MKRLFEWIFFQRRGERTLPKDKLYTIGRYENNNSCKYDFYSMYDQCFFSILDEVRCDFGSSIHLSFSWIEHLSQVGGENQKCSPNNLVPMLTLSTDSFYAYLLCLAVIKTTALFCLCPKWKKKLLSGWRSRAWKCIQVKIILSSKEDRSIPE